MEQSPEKLTDDAAKDLRESRVRSLLKAVSYRIIGTLTTAGLTFLVTGDIQFAVTMGVVEPVAKIIIYYLHERAWQAVPRGTVRRLTHIG